MLIAKTMPVANTMPIANMMLIAHPEMGASQALDITTDSALAKAGTTDPDPVGATGYCWKMPKIREYVHLLTRLSVTVALTGRKLARLKRDKSSNGAMSGTHHRAKILVADDDQMVRLLTRQCLESEDMTVVEASNGPETLEVFLRERPDLVFLDVEMPGMSGLEVCRRLRETPQGESLPIMIVTGSDDRRSIDQGFEAGATQYKTKPVNWSLLGRDVQYMLRASNAFNALKRQEDRLRYLAYYDPLTSLPNRRSFNEQLTRILKRANRHNSCAALLFIDLDHFKRINDSIGHGRGDRLLVEIARRLTLELREDDAINYLSDSPTEEDDPEVSPEIARLGGDEFTVVLSDVEDIADVRQVAKRILHALSEPIPLQSHTPVVTPSIGIAMYPQDGTDPDVLVRNADTAMYAAKAEGRACYRFYDEQMNARAVEQLKMEEELRDALQNG
jgi:PleD family two-component response regulator